jgi:hypothetical protein
VTNVNAQKAKNIQTLREIFDEEFKESIKATLHKKALREKEKQDAQASKGTQDASGTSQGGSNSLFSDDDTGDDQDAPAPSKTADDEAEKLKGGDIEPDDIIEKLNSIRSGKSFKDENISKSMSQYIGSLSKAEKVALFAFVKGIAQIVTGEVTAQQASDPDKKPADVQMHKGDDKSSHTKHITPNVIRAQRPKAAKGPGKEDRTPPAPITPKQKSG